MGFSQQDDGSVIDDEGNIYTLPFLKGSGVAAPPDVAPEDPYASLPNLDATGAELPPIPQAQAAPTELPSMSGQSPPEPQLAAPLQTQPASAGGPPGPRSKPALDAASARNNVLVNDVSAFSKAGGTAGSDSDYMRMVGGAAEHQAQTAEAKADLNDTLTQAKIAKTKTMADLILETADQYDNHVKGIMTDAKAKWNDWTARSKKAAEELVKPENAFTNGGAMSKINWSMYLFGAGLQGGDTMNGAMQVMNKMIEDDMSAQKFNIETKRAGLNEERQSLMEQDKLNKEEVTSWYFAKNLRLQAVGQGLDAKIAELGLPAARKAGLLQARDVIEKEVLKNQSHVADHIYTTAERKGREAHDIYLERLKSNLRMAEDAFKEKVKKADKNDTLPTNTQLGLQMVDRASGQLVVGGKIPLKVKGEKAVEAGNILAQANEEASQLQDVRSKLKGMTSTDLVRGGSPEFKAMVKDLIQTRAVRDNGHRLSDADVDRAAQEEFGVVMKDHLGANIADAARLTGPYKEGVEKTIDMQLRNLSKKTVNKLHPYIDSDAAEQFDIQYNVQGTHDKEPSDQADDLNTAITKAGGGANTSDLLAPGPRSSVEANSPVMYDSEAVKAYNAEKEKGRGLEGGLPRLADKDEEKVNQATAAFSHANADEIIRLASAYLRDPGLGEEAKHEIRLESLNAVDVAQEKEKAVVEQAADKYQRANMKGGKGAFESAQPANDAYDENGKYTKDFQKYLESGLVDEMRKKAGLIPRKR